MTEFLIRFINPSHYWVVRVGRLLSAGCAVGFLSARKSTGPLDKLEIVTELVEVVPEYGNADVGFPLLTQPSSSPLTFLFRGNNPSEILHLIFSPLFAIKNFLSLLRIQSCFGLISSQWLPQHEPSPARLSNRHPPLLLSRLQLATPHSLCPAKLSASNLDADTPLSPQSPHLRVSISVSELLLLAALATTSTRRATALSSQVPLAKLRVSSLPSSRTTRRCTTRWRRGWRRRTITMMDRTALCS